MFVYAMRQWWGRYGVTTGLSILVLLGAWSFRESNGRILYELYSQVARPFALPEDRQQLLMSAHTKELAANLEEQRQENARLRQLINETPLVKSEPLFAPIVGRSANHWWQTVIIGRGSADGVSVNDVVVAPGGLVGRVARVSTYASQVLMVSDASSRVGITVTRSRAAGVMRGVGRSTAIIEFFEKLPDVKVGDVLTTSHFSTRFPAGIPIGTVTSVDLSASPAPQAEVELFAPLGNLEWVSVHTYSESMKNPEIPSTDTNRELEILLDDEEE